VRRFADVAEVQRESLSAIDSIYVEDFSQRLHQWEGRWGRPHPGIGGGGGVLKAKKVPTLRGFLNKIF